MAVDEHREPTTFAERLRALALRVEEAESRLAKTPTLADAIFLASVDEFLSQIVGEEGDFLPQNAAGAQKKAAGQAEMLGRRPPSPA